jgi:integrase
MADGGGFEPPADPTTIEASRLPRRITSAATKNIDDVLTLVLTPTTWQACGSIRNPRFGRHVSRFDRRIFHPNVGNGVCRPRMASLRGKLPMRLMMLAEMFSRNRRSRLSPKKFATQKRKPRVARIFADVFRFAAGREFGAGSLRAFADSWLAGIEPQLSPRSYPKYEAAARGFVRFLGAAADRDLIGFGPRDDVLILQFRDHLAKRLAPGSVNDALKIIRQMFKTASQRFKIESPAHFVSGVRNDTTQASQRRAFTLPELGRILRAARDSEWEGIILAGLCTGQRLSDIVVLRWENVDLARGEIALTTRKTNRRILIPIAEPLHDYLLKIPASDDPKAFVFQKAAAQLQRSKSEHSAGLSNQFHDILASAGLVQRRSHQKAKDGKGRSARRGSSEISFHSLRHTTTSLLKNAGVPQSVVMDIIGHESRAVSQVYTHVGDAEKRQAMAALPAVATLLRASKQRDGEGAKRKKRKIE